MFIGQYSYGKETTMKIKYKKVNVRTVEGIKEAEKLKNEGWVIYSNDFNFIYFYKKGE